MGKSSVEKWRVEKCREESFIIGKISGEKCRVE